MLEKLELIGFTTNLANHTLDFHGIAHLTKPDNFSEEGIASSTELRLSLNCKPLQCAESTSAGSNLIRSLLCMFIAQSVGRDVKVCQGSYIVVLANGDDKIVISITVHSDVCASVSICRVLCTSPSVRGV